MRAAGNARQSRARQARLGLRGRAAQAAIQHNVVLTWLKLVRTAVVDAGEGIAEVVG